MYSASAYNRFADLFSENDTGGMLEWFWEHEHITEPLSAGRPEANNALYLLLKTKKF